MSRKLDFEFYVGGLETAILALLKNGNADINQAGMTGVKTFATYAGELDRDKLIEALKALSPRFPLVLASYGSGADKRKAATGMLPGEPIENEHHCGFVVIVACNDLRGEQARKTTAYKMIAEVRQLLGGVQFEIAIDEEDEAEPLNHAPLALAGVETIGRLPDLTAYAAHFETMFHEWTPDRRVVIAGRADEILLGIEPSVENENLPSAENLPGIRGAIKNL